MFTPINAFTSFSVNDLAVAREFYGTKLGIDIKLDGSPNMIMFTNNGTDFMVYPKDDHIAATYTVLNFRVENTEAALETLAEQGVKPDMTVEGVNEKGISEHGPTKFAWLLDPAGNSLGVVQGL